MKEKNDFNNYSPFRFSNAFKIALDAYGQPRQSAKLLGMVQKNAHCTENVRGDVVYYLRVDAAQMEQPEPCVLVARVNVGKELGYVISYLND